MARPSRAQNSTWPAMDRSADSLAYANVGLVPLFFYNELYAVQPWVQGFEVPVIFNGQRWTKVRLEQQR